MSTLRSSMESAEKHSIRHFRRNKQRFPSDFAFQLSKEEFDQLRSQIVTSSLHGGRRYRPYAFIGQGVAMLSSVLRSTRAVEGIIAIMRTFLQLRHLLGHQPRPCSQGL